MPRKSTWQFLIQVAAYNVTDDTGAGWFFRGAIRAKSDGTMTLLGSTVADTAYADAAMSAAAVAITAANGSLCVTVTGLAGKTIRWTVVIHTVEAAVLV